MCAAGETVGVEYAGIVLCNSIVLFRKAYVSTIQIQGKSSGVPRIESLFCKE